MRSFALLALAALIWASAAWARGGGGCLEQGTLISTPAGPVAIEDLRPGDPVFTIVDGHLRATRVAAVTEVDAESYVEIAAAGRVLRATPEHPFKIALGVFREAARLKSGDTVFLRHGDGVVATPIESVVATVAPKRHAYNLLVEQGGVFLANDLVVHNKGCFLPDTPILRADGTQSPIAEIRPGDRLLAFTGDGTVVQTSVRNIITHQVDEYVELRTRSVMLRVTPEHPFFVGDGTFKTVEALKAGDSIFVLGKDGLRAERIVSLASVRVPTLVYNLQTDRPNTFFANGVAVHNKGGGCLEQGTLISTPAGPVAIEDLRPGDPVYTVAGGHLRATRVAAITEVDPESYVEIAAAGKILRATPEHPFQIGAGVFREASRLKSGDTLFLRRGKDVVATPIDSVGSVAPQRRAYNLLVEQGGVFLANDVVVHNKGCFLPDTPILRADGSQSPIAQIRPGDRLLAFTGDGSVVQTSVRNVITHQVDEYVELRTPSVMLRVTPEHPFFVGDGTFKTVEALKPGDSIFVLGQDGLRAERIVSLASVRAPTLVYNLQTDQPNTFFANGVAVHNKGGGCFGPDTRIRTPKGEIAISQLKPGDVVVALDERGGRIETSIDSVETTRSALLRIDTDRGALTTTREHPLLTDRGDFREAGDLREGDRIVMATASGIANATVRAASAGAESQVFTLSVGEPHTFIADGFVVHNKGGGFHSSGSGHSSGSSTDDPWGVVFASCIVVVYLLNFLNKPRRDRTEDLDFSYSRPQIARKSDKTAKLLSFLARTDPAMAPDKLREAATGTFTRLQRCWSDRDYAPMRPRMMPSLYAEHCAQIAGMVRNHEINMIADLKIEAVDLVNVRYTAKEDTREFTALFSARARDYYTDDRTVRFLRGDQASARFQEFWTFQRQDGAWLLREIEQTRESDALKDENFFEHFTDVGRDQVYAEAAGKAGPAGPWLETGTQTKATRTERLLNFLVQTDKLWDRTAMLERARSVFLQITLARERGDPAAIPRALMFPEPAAALQAQLDDARKQGLLLELRNLCVRKVELILVRNFADNSKDEFTVRISAHAQKGVVRNGKLESQQEYVMPFLEYWTFGRLDGEWKFKESLPPARGESLVAAENVDEGSTPAQLEWFYKQPRAPS